MTNQEHEAVCGDRQPSYGYICVMSPGHVPQQPLHHDADGRGWLGQP